MNPVLAQDSGTGTSASLGGKGSCFKWQWPVGINAKAVVRRSRGAGVHRRAGLHEVTPIV